MDYISSPQVQQVLKTITEGNRGGPQPDPFGYIKRLQEEFPYEDCIFPTTTTISWDWNDPTVFLSEWVENGTHEGKDRNCFRTDKEIKI